MSVTLTRRRTARMNKKALCAARLRRFKELDKTPLETGAAIHRMKLSRFRSVDELFSEFKGSFMCIEADYGEYAVSER